MIHSINSVRFLKLSTGQCFGWFRNGNEPFGFALTENFIKKRFKRIAMISKDTAENIAGPNTSNPLFIFDHGQWNI